MTNEYLEIQAYVERMELYLVIVGCLFVLAVGATAYLLFWLKDEEGDVDE